MRPRIVIAACLACLLAAGIARASQEDPVWDLPAADADALALTQELTAGDHALGRRLLKKGSDDGPGHHHGGDDDDDDDDDDEGDDDGGGGAPAGPLAPAGIPCTLKVGSKTVTYKKCLTMGAGITYWTLTGNTASVGFRVASSGWAALAFGTPHSGASAVWATGNSAKGVTMRGGHSSSSISAPSRIKFSNIKARKTGGEYVVTFTMPWSGAATRVALATGPGAKSQHNTIPKVYTVTKADLA